MWFRHRVVARYASHIVQLCAKYKLGGENTATTSYDSALNLLWFVEMVAQNMHPTPTSRLSLVIHPLIEHCAQWWRCKRRTIAPISIRLKSHFASDAKFARRVGQNRLQMYTSPRRNVIPFNPSHKRDDAWKVRGAFENECVLEWHLRMCWEKTCLISQWMDEWIHFCLTVSREFIWTNALGQVVAAVQSGRGRVRDALVRRGRRWHNECRTNGQRNMTFIQNLREKSYIDWFYTPKSNGKLTTLYFNHSSERFTIDFELVNRNKSFLCKQVCPKFRKIITQHRYYTKRHFKSQSVLTHQPNNRIAVRLARGSKFKANCIFRKSSFWVALSLELSSCGVKYREWNFQVSIQLAILRDSDDKKRA